MRMEGVKELEAIKAAMENQDSKLSNSPNINASQRKELPVKVKEIKVDFSPDKSKFFNKSSITFQNLFFDEFFA